MEVLKGFGRLFYIVNPSETYVEKIEGLNHSYYVQKAIPYFITLIFLEYALQVYTNKRRTRFNDGFVSMANGMYMGIQDVLFKGFEHYVYIKIYEHWRVMELPWDSPYTWYLALLGVDLGYYWAHRACHEINFFWAQHQIHHSSEDYNLTTALRQAAFQSWIVWMFYLPMAFFVPPTVCLIHQQFNLLFQFWIHTEVIDSVGPLEWVLNTPRHHRIHHGSNRYCLDKNYAGVFIIWDRMFGTFAAEKPGEKIVYGLVEDVKSFNPFWLQIFYYPKIWNRIKSYEKWGDKISTVLKGPGWVPGKERLGDIMDVPVFPTRERYDVKIPFWKTFYAALHFAILLITFHFISAEEFKHMFTQTSVMFFVVFLLTSLTSIGFVLEDRQVGGLTEILRSSVVIFGILFVAPGSIGAIWRQLILGVYGLSVGVWGVQLAFAKDKPAAAKKKGKSIKNGIQNGIQNGKSASKKMK